MPVNPFAKVEKQLIKPNATGIFVTYIAPSASPQVARALKAGDIITHIGGKPVKTEKVFYELLQPKDKDDKMRGLTVMRAGKTIEREIPSGRALGFDLCFVKKGVRGWDPRPDTEYKPDFSALKAGEIWLRNSLGNELAGFELLRIKPDGGHVEVETLFRLGGGEAGQTWDYRTRGRSRHKLDKHLSIVSTAFWEGTPGEEKLKGDVKIDGGRWTGVHGTPQGEKKAEFKAPATGMLTGYTTTLLPLTMPLQKGASVLFLSSADGVGFAKERARIECLGRRKTKHLGKDVAAWCFAWRHYGAPNDAEDEKFWVDDERRMLRIDWGPRYGNCWCELVNGPGDLKGLPKHVKVE
ncbi:MAG: PDZ domain-containing protein [Planctomycetes bacterium]|nr:PDZ domain-containing protein [Planctomycetota bacterium]